MSIQPRGVLSSMSAESGVPTILLVDDSESDRLLAGTGLVAAGFALEGAANGREALAKAQLLRPDCIVLDVQLPDMSGIDVCKALRAHPDTSECAIVMLSISDDNADKAESFLVGADDYVIKPCSQRDLVARVEAALRPRAAASVTILARADPALLEMLRGARDRSLHDVVTELEPLSTRQLEILRRLLDGDRVPSIARDLHVSASTVRNHLSCIFRKLGVQSLQELVPLLRTIQMANQSTPTARVVSGAQPRPEFRWLSASVSRIADCPVPMTPRILLVDDDAGDASLVRAALAAEIGADVIWVETFTDALIELGASTVACVVLDLGLPDGDGLELVDTLLAAQPDVPIVVLTGRDDAVLAVAAVQRGAQDYLLKSELGSRLVGRAVTYAIERAGNRAALARNELHYRTVIDSLGEGLIVQSADGQIQTANAAAARPFGLTIDQLLGRDWCDPRWHAVDEEGNTLPGEAQPAMVALRTNQPLVDVTIGVHPPAGDLRWLEVSAFPMSDGPDIAPYAVVVSLRDVTDKRAAIQRTRFQADLLDAVGQAIIATDTTGTIIYWNHAAEQQCGWAACEALGKNLIELTTPDVAEHVEQIVAELTAGRSWTGDLRILRRDGTSFSALVTHTPVLDETGQIAAIIVVATDITERELTEDTMRHLSSIVESSNDAIIGKTLDGVISSWNRGAESLYGYTAAEVIGRPVAMLAPAEYRAELADEIRRVALGETVMHNETMRRRKDGTSIDVSVTVSPVYGSDGAVIACSAIARDITARAEAQRALAHQAVHDSLTGLPNRVLLEDRLDQAMARARRHEGRVAVLFMDLDGFKVVNDGLGHLAGDELLVAVAHRLAGCVRPTDTLARFGGDEFVIVCEVASIEGAWKVGDRVLKALQAPFAVQGSDLFVTASIGLVVAETDANCDELLRDADAAMYKAKHRGRARMEMFDHDLRERAASKLQSATDLRRALERDELELFYQPIVVIDDSRPFGVEALLRWRHPERGLVSPAEFIPLAEETGMIVPIGKWVLQEALRQRAAWEAELPDQAPLLLSVNLSACQLSEPKLIDDVTAALSANGNDPRSLILEVTESVLMHDPDSLSTLNAIHDLGVTLHVDDFGTGYSSLAYLKTLPVDVLKIDRAFVDGLGTDTDDHAIVTAVIALARALSLGVVAEGVETERQSEVLRELGCDHAQGYLFARPMPYDELVAWLKKPTLVASRPAVPCVPRAIIRGPVHPPSANMPAAALNTATIPKATENPPVRRAV